MKRESLIVILAVLAARGWMALIGAIDLGMHVLYPGHIGLWLIYILGPVLMMRSAGCMPSRVANLAFCVGVGLSTDQSVYLVLREDPQQSYWAWPSWLGTVILTGAVLVMLWVLSRTEGDSGTGGTHWVNERLDLCWRILWGAFLILWPVFRLADVAATVLGISYTNEEVSLFVLGYEVHHIWWGTLAIIGSGLRFLSPLHGGKALRNVSWIMCLGMAFAADELLYYMERHMTLESYLAFPSLLGAIGATFGALLVAWLARRSMYGA